MSSHPEAAGTFVSNMFRALNLRSENLAACIEYELGWYESCCLWPSSCRLRSLFIEMEVSFTHKIYQNNTASNTSLPFCAALTKPRAFHYILCSHQIPKLPSKGRMSWDNYAVTHTKQISPLYSSFTWTWASCFQLELLLNILRYSSSATSLW